MSDENSKEKNYLKDNFTSSPIPMWEDNLDKVFELFDEFSDNDSFSIVNFIEENPQFYRKINDIIIPVDLNHSALELFSLSDKNSR